MKAKFKLGFLVGWQNIPKAWPGATHAIKLEEPVPATVSVADIPYDHTSVRELIFQCTKIDEDKAAVYEFVAIK